jgi:cysteinyl-tRNA synthetase
MFQLFRCITLQRLAKLGIKTFVGHAAGNRQCIVDGALTKRLQAGQAASAGVFSAVLARKAFTGAHLLVDGQKMSKSLGNFYTLRDVLEKGYSGREVRYALSRVHYRAPLNFTWEGMEEARQSLGRIDEWLQRLREKAGTEVARGTSPYDKFADALDDDLNISAALGILFDSIRETNRRLDAGELPSTEARSWLDWWNRQEERPRKLT